MRHILKPSPLGWTCTRCGQSFGEEETAEGIMGQVCTGAKTGYTVTSKWATSREIIDAFFIKHFEQALTNYPTSYEDDTETKGRKLIEEWEKGRGS